MKNCSTLPGLCFSHHPSCVYFPAFSASVYFFPFQQEQPDKIQKSGRANMASHFLLVKDQCFWKFCAGLSLKEEKAGTHGLTEHGEALG
jgi:hypothetical protein